MLKFSTFLKDLGSIRSALIWSVVLFAVGIGAGWVSTGPLEELLLNQIGGLREVSERLEQGEMCNGTSFCLSFSIMPSKVYLSSMPVYSSEFCLSSSC